MKQPAFINYIINYFIKYFNSLIHILSVLFLTACGGSSGSSNAVIPANLQTTLSPPTYLAGSEELAAFNAINTFRNNMGLGYWLQNNLLDQAAINHMNYSIANDPTFQQDLEIEGKPGFTGITPSQRAIYTGYFVLINTINAANVPTAAVGELYSIGPGINVINAMINTIYHRSSLMAQTTRAIGLARDTNGVATPNTHWWFNHGRLDGGQSVASNFLSYYPLNQQNNVPLSMTSENPSVYSNQANFNFATQTSSPINFTSAASTALKVKSFTVTQAGSTTPLPGTIWTLSNDPNLALSDAAHTSLSLSNPNPPMPVPTISPYEAYWVGNAPFLPNTTYNVNFAGSTYLIVRNLTQDVAQSWSFTTGSN